MFNLFGKKVVKSFAVPLALQENTVVAVNYEKIKLVFAHRDMCQQVLENDHSTFNVDSYDQVFATTSYVPFKKEERVLSVAESMFNDLFGEYHQAVL
jgi:hypothetical protein